MKGLILCNGLAPDISLFKRHHDVSDLFIAADGGGNSARKLGFLPDVVIGDLDSFKQQPDDDFEIIKDSDQETNDLEKALELASDRDLYRGCGAGRYRSADRSNPEEPFSTQKVQQPIFITFF
ncbi:MAG: hypothetical protein U5K69_10680 [Balneolaceae bacterium]|nr:hypothetical protein [Balneolaceae bacterium]